jgi:histidine ammonia-lyase
MGANAATKALRVFQNLERIVAIELLTAAQALEFRRPAQSSPAVEGLMEAFREKSPFDDRDRTWYLDMELAVKVLREFKPEC